MWLVQLRANEVDRVRGTLCNRILLALGISGYFISQLQRVSVNQVSKDAQLGSPMQQLQIGIRTLGHR